MKYSDRIEEISRKFFSVNFLIAEFEKIENLDTDYVKKRNLCEVYETKDFQTRMYYKQISSCINKFDEND